ncbi:hypothetical protein Bbelb_364250 [Branchiostoma belcheri]|nr:hypothetical protein Bbelb_364250 [Branchiostoma belcheri]
MSSLRGHITNLRKLCRLCGAKVQTANEKKRHLNPSLCIDYKVRIRNTFNLDVTKDQTHIHPPYFCEKCRKKLTNKKYDEGKATASVWTEHNSDCLPFKDADQMIKGGEGDQRREVSPEKWPQIKTSPVHHLHLQLLLVLTLSHHTPLSSLLTCLSPRCQML